MLSTRRVLLVNPSPLYAADRAAGGVNMLPGLVSLFSYLRAHRAEVDVLDLHVELRTPRTSADAPGVASESASRVLARDFDLLAISCNSSFHYLGALDLAVAVRAADDSVPIVVGGCHATAVPEDFLFPDSPFDVVVRGDGEVELLDLARTLVRRPPQPEVRVARSLPLDEAFVDLTGYPYWKPRPHVIQFPLSRGCPFTCAFCAGADRAAWRSFPPAAALEVVRQMLAADPEVIGFSDACFGLRSAWRREFLEGLVALAPAVAVNLETRVEFLAGTDLDLLSRLDAQVDLGVETASPRMAEVMGKASDGVAYVRRARRVIAELGSRHIATHVYLLLNHPGEDVTSLGETVAFAGELADRAGELSAFATAHSFMHLPGTEVARRIDYWQQQGVTIGHPFWWRERTAQGALADDVRTRVPEEHVRAAMDLLLQERGRAISGIPIDARMTWRRVRAPLKLGTSAPVTN